jgi:hypothetical protein
MNQTSPKLRLKTIKRSVIATTYKEAIMIIADLNIKNK